MPEDFSFLQIMDLFYKIHKVFNLQYNPHVKRMMNFIEYYVFEHKAKYIVLTPSMQELNHNLFD